MTRKISFGLGLLGLALVACGTKDDSGASATTVPADTNDDNDDNDDNAEDPPDDSSDDGPDTNDDNDDDNDDNDDNAEDPPSTSEESDDGADDGNFILEPDGAGFAFECDIWAQDCPEGEKCMPWSNDGAEWNATRCSPLDPNPAQPGDECSVEGSGTSGIDNCALGAMCWNVDPETNMGTCVPFCGGSEANPVCTDPATTCTIANEGALILCLPNCDPLLQDCGGTEACYPVNDTFVCGPDVSGEEGLFGDACAFINVCDPGLFCANPAIVPGCESDGCCSTFCELDDPGSSAACPGAAGGQECTPWFEEGQAPPGLENVGACGIPA